MNAPSRIVPVLLLLLLLLLGAVVVVVGGAVSRIADDCGGAVSTIILFEYDTLFVGLPSFGFRCVICCLLLRYRLIDLNLNTGIFKVYYSYYYYYYCACVLESKYRMMNGNEIESNEIESKYVSFKRMYLCDRRLLSSYTKFKKISTVSISFFLFAE